MSKWKPFDLPARALRLLRFAATRGDGGPAWRAMQVDGSLGVVAAGNGHIMGAMYPQGLDTGADGVLNLKLEHMREAAGNARGSEVIRVDVTGESPKKAAIRHGTTKTKVDVVQGKVPAMAGALPLTQPMDVSYLDANLIVQLAKYIDGAAAGGRFPSGYATDIPVVEVRRLEHMTQFWFRDNNGDRHVVAIAHLELPPAHGWLGNRALGLPPDTLAMACDHHHKQRGGPAGK